jgi:hypothetical protein
MHQLIQAQTAVSMQSSLVVSTTMATQTQDLPEPAADIIHEDESVSQTVCNDLAAELGPTTAKIVGSCVNIALESFISDTQSDNRLVEIQPEHSEPMYHHRGALDDQKLIRSDGMRVIHQTTQERTYNVWLASITIRSTTTKLQEIADGDERGQQDYDESFQTVFKIEIRPHYFIRARFLATMSCQGLGAHPLNSDMRIRCYNIVDFDAPIAIACRRGDIATIRRLFASRQASPFDTLSDPDAQTGQVSLLTVVANMCTAIPIVIRSFSEEPHMDKVRDMNNRLKLLEYLIDQGLDPGEPGEVSVLWQLFRLLSDCDMALLPIVQRIIRLVFERSTQNPFHGPRHTRKIGAISYMTTNLLKDFIKTQEIWPMTDLEDAIKDLQSPPVRYEGFFLERISALLRDPNGLQLHHYLQSFIYTSQQLLQYCAIMITSSRAYPMETVCIAIEQRLIQCLQAGMDPQERLAMKVWLGDYTLYSLASESGALDVLTSALIYTGRSISEIDTIFEYSKYIILEAELSSLRPTSLYRSLDYATPTSVLQSKAMVFDESYHKMFPGEEMEYPSLYEIFGPRGYWGFSGYTKRIDSTELFNECVITDRMEDDYVFIILASTAVQAKILEELKPFER